jgi:hypothetical protein
MPNTIASLHIPDSDERLLAAGGQDAELHLSIYSRRTSPRSTSDPASRASRRLWQYDDVLSGSINNSVLLTSLSLTRSNESSAEPRVAVSNNDCTVKFFDVNVRGAKGVDGPPKRISEVGTLRLDVPVNHCTLSLLFYPIAYRGPGAPLTSPLAWSFRSALHSLDLSRRSHTSLCRRLTASLLARHDWRRANHFHSTRSADPSAVQPTPNHTPATRRWYTPCIVLHRVLALRLQICCRVPGGHGRGVGCSFPQADEGLQHRS